MLAVPAGKVGRSREAVAVVQAGKAQGIPIHNYLKSRRLFNLQEHQHQAAAEFAFVPLLVVAKFFGH